MMILFPLLFSFFSPQTISFFLSFYLFRIYSCIAYIHTIPLTEAKEYQRGGIGIKNEDIGNSKLGPKVAFEYKKMFKKGD